MDENSALSKPKVWVNSKWLTSDNKKIEKWKPAAAKDKVLWGSCSCGAAIYEGDAVGMEGDHTQVVCFDCWRAGALPEGHLDCCNLRLPDATLSQ